jgi:hypothetical protein
MLDKVRGQQIVFQSGTRGDFLGRHSAEKLHNGFRYGESEGF